MDDALTYQGFAVDAETALALLIWQQEFGVDEPILDAPVDRFQTTTRQPIAAPSPAPTPVNAEIDWISQAHDLAKSAADLTGLAEAQREFDGIELKKGARNFVFADGNPKARVLMLGEAPGAKEDQLGRPFAGPSGQMLDRMLAAIGLARDHVDASHAVYITNVLPWRPLGDRDPTADEIAMMLPFVKRHIDLVDPEIVVLIGNAACEAGLGKRGVTRLRGAWTTAFERPALAMMHPAYLLRRPIAKREAWADLLMLADRLAL